MENYPTIFKETASHIIYLDPIKDCLLGKRKNRKIGKKEKK